MSKKISALPTYSDPLSSTAYVPTVIGGSTYKFDLNNFSDGSVTSVALSLPSFINVSGSPITSSGTITGTLANQNANLVFAGPSSGSAAEPTFRALNSSDIPNISYINNYKSLISVDSSTDIITTPSAHGLVEGDTVFFSATSLPGNISANTRYYARDITSTTFKVSSVFPVSTAINISSNGTDVYISTNDGLDRRGNYVRGRGNKQTNNVSTYGSALSISGNNNSISTLMQYTDYAYQYSNSSSHVFGDGNTISGSQGLFFVFGSDNLNVKMGSGGTLCVFGNLHLGGGQDHFFGGGFHNLGNGVGTTDLSSSGAQIGEVGSGTKMTGLGGINMFITGAGTHAYWQGFQAHASHGNKDRGMHTGTLTLNTIGSIGTLANGATRTSELVTYRYPISQCDQSTGINTTSNVFTVTDALANNTSVRLSSTESLPSPLVVDTTYYVVNASGLTFQLSATSGGAAIDITTTGSGRLHFIDPIGLTKWLRLMSNKVYTFEFTCVTSLASATTPAYAIYRRRASYYQGATIGTAPTLIGSVETIGTDLGSNAGSPPADWDFNINHTTDGLHVTVTTKNTDGTARNVQACCKVEALEVTTI